MPNEMHPTLAAVQEKLSKRGIHSEYKQMAGGVHHLVIVPEPEKTDHFVRGLAEELGDATPDKIKRETRKQDVRLINALEAFMATHGPKNLRLDLVPGRQGVIIQAKESEHERAYSELLPHLTENRVEHELVPEAEGIVMRIPRTEANVERLSSMLTKWFGGLPAKRRKTLQPRPGALQAILAALTGRKPPQAPNGDHLFRAWVEDKTKGKTSHIESIANGEPHLRITVTPKR